MWIANNIWRLLRHLQGINLSVALVTSMAAVRCSQRLNTRLLTYLVVERP